jgi:hypothetical protein
MKLSQELITHIKTIADTSKQLGITDIIIESGTVRAMDEGKTILLLQANDIELPFASIYINRLDVLLNRWQLVDNREGFSIEATVNEKDKQVIVLNMKATGVKVDFRCANSNLILIPKQLNDISTVKMHLNPEGVALLAKGVGAMGSEFVTIVGKDTGVSFELTDSNTDVFSHVLTTDVELLTPESKKIFAHRYPVKTILALFKLNSDQEFSIGKKGIIKITTNGLDAYVMPNIG